VSVAFNKKINISKKDRIFFIPPKTLLGGIFFD